MVSDKFLGKTSTTFEDIIKKVFQFHLNSVSSSIARLSVGFTSQPKSQILESIFFLKQSQSKQSQAKKKITHSCNQSAQKIGILGCDIIFLQSHMHGPLFLTFRQLFTSKVPTAGGKSLCMDVKEFYKNFSQVIPNCHLADLSCLPQHQHHVLHS